MPIRNVPFIKIKEARGARPWLPIILSNPETGEIQPTYGLIDTGADECTVPSLFADILGHNLKAVKPKIITTAGGEAYAYPHTTTIDILNKNHDKVAHSMSKVIIDYTDGLYFVLLGVKGFLDQFILEIDYPIQAFSIKK